MLINEFIDIKGKTFFNRTITILLSVSIIIFFFFFNIHLLVWVDCSVSANSTFIDHIAPLESSWLHVSLRLIRFKINIKFILHSNLDIK